MQVKFSINGDIQLSRNLRIASAKIQDFQPFHKDAVDIMHERSDDIFSSGGSNVEKSPKWKELTPGVLKARSSRYGYYKQATSNPGILRWTGKLQDNIRKESNPRSGTFAFLQSYAVYHQEGGGNLPKRAIIDLSNATNTKIVKALQKRVNDVTKIFGSQL